VRLAKRLKGLGGADAASRGTCQPDPEPALRDDAAALVAALDAIAGVVRA
jgi:hypothetical protein